MLVKKKTLHNFFLKHPAGSDIRELEAPDYNIREQDEQLGRVGGTRGRRDTYSTGHVQPKPSDQD